MRRLVIGLIALVTVEATLLTLDALFPPDFSRGLRSSPVALDRNGVWLRALPVEDGRWRIRADLKRTDKSFIRRLVAVEDARFWIHPGVDPISLARAIVSALIHGRVTSGASTLTMQTARLLEPRPRTVPSKLIEMLRAVQIEERLSKRQILGLYLTLAPYGGNLEGVRAASLAYFGHQPESLTPSEQALLIALPQSPEARRPDRRPVAARAGRAAVLDKFVRAHVLSRADADEANQDPMPARSPFPSLAWHLAGQAAHAAPKDQATVITTIDAPLQARLEPLAAEAARGQGPAGTAAVIVVDIRSRAVMALVGSAGLDRPGGWIDITRALRSPGSTLKPFIYGFAFDDGIVAPDTQIDDTQTRFNDYQPENFDRVFHGKVTARQALTYSLNVPAVATLNKIGADAFQARLETSGARLVRPKARATDAGLALALGGAGITLRDLALLYAALGDGGLAKPLAYTREQAAARPRQGGVRLMRSETAQQVLDILRETPAPSGRPPSALTRRGPRMAFKTGTSYGFRDAVAAGVVSGYVVIAWTGRADGGARAGLSGRDAALPLLFDAADAIDPAPVRPSPIAPRDAPPSLQTLERPDSGPALVFPPDGATVQVEAVGPASRGLVLSARGRGLNWYVDGAALPQDRVSGRVIWRPASAGFYRVVVADSEGRQAKAQVRIKLGG